MHGLSSQSLQTRCTNPVLLIGLMWRRPLGGPDPYSASKARLSSYFILRGFIFADTDVSVSRSEQGISSVVVTGLKHALFQTLCGHGLHESLCSCDDRTQFAPGNTF